MHFRKSHLLSSQPEALPEYGRAGVGNLLNAVCQLTNNIKMKATSHAKHFYVFGLHSQLPDLNSKRMRQICLINFIG